MKNKYTLLILMVVAVNLSRSHDIQPPAYTASFSRSSSSASAYSHASSSSYSYGNVNPNEFEQLKESLKAGAAATATAGAIAGAGAVAGANAFANAGAFAGSGSIAGANANSGAGVNAALSEATGGAGILGSGCSGENGCGQHTNAIDGSAPVDVNSYKVINSDKYTTGYTSGSKTNYAVNSNYVHGSQHTAGDCASCKGLHDYKPATAVSSGTYNVAGTGAVNAYRPSGSVNSLPGAPGGIYASKPATGYHPPSANAAAASDLHHISPSLIATLPGRPGSIHDSKPVGAVSGASASATAGSHVTTGTYNVASSHPVSKPSCAPGSLSCGSSVAQKPVAGPGLSEIIGLFPGPSGSIHDSRPVGSKPTHHGGAGASASAGSQVSTGSHTIVSTHPVAAPGITSTYKPSSHVFPGPSGSIHDNKPATSQPGYVTGGAGAGASAVAGSQVSTGTHTIVPTHPVVSPGSHVFTGPSGSIHDNKPAPSQPGYTAGSNTGAGASAASQVSTGSHTVVPIHPVSTQTYKPASHVFPGSSGSIHDSKPATSKPGYIAGSNTGAGASASSVTGSHTTGSQNVVLPHPVAVPAPMPSYKPSSHHFPGPSGSIYDSKPATSAAGHGTGSKTDHDAALSAYSGAGSVTNIPTHHPVIGPACSYTPGSSNKCHSSISGAGAGANANAAAQASAESALNSYSGAGSVTNIPSHHPVVGPACSYTPGSPSKCQSSIPQQAGVDISTNVPAQAGVKEPTLLAPSIHPEAPSSGTYYINKPTSEIEPPHVSSSPSFTGQFPCADSNCGSIQKENNCGTNGGCGAQTGAASGSYSGSQASAGSAIVYNERDHTGQYQGVNHDQAHLSGGLVFQNQDGSYSNQPTTGKTTYKNAEHGGHAVGSADYSGILIGPGTGSLPIESDKPFGSQGFGGGSVGYEKSALEKSDKTLGTQGSVVYEKSTLTNKEVPFGSAVGGSAATSHSQVSTNSGNKPFGTQGFGGGSAAFAKSSANSHNSEPTSTIGDGFVSGDVVIQKSNGIEVSPVEEKPLCTTGSCKTGITTGPNVESTNQANINKQIGTPVKLDCSGAHCGDTEVFIVEEKPASNYGFANGQVLVNQGSNTYDITNSGSNLDNFGSSYSGSQAGTYSQGSQYGSTLCSTGRCNGGQGFAIGGSFGLPSAGGFLHKLFGAGGLSGNGFNVYRGGASMPYGVSYSKAGSYSSASSGSYASSGASASAHAGSFAATF